MDRFSETLKYVEGLSDKETERVQVAIELEKHKYDKPKFYITIIGVVATVLGLLVGYLISYFERRSAFETEIALKFFELEDDGLVPFVRNVENFSEVRDEFKAKLRKALPKDISVVPAGTSKQDELESLSLVLERLTDDNTTKRREARGELIEAIVDCKTANCKIYLNSEFQVDQLLTSAGYRRALGIVFALSKLEKTALNLLLTDDPKVEFTSQNNKITEISFREAVKRKLLKLRQMNEPAISGAADRALRNL